jgi:single-strand DNA-binding protein
MNNITIAGPLGKDAEIRYMPNGDPVASFSVADSQGRDKPTIWWRCTLYGKRAESLSPYLTKGQAVAISGTVTERQYEKDGQTRTSTEIRVNDVALQGGQREKAGIPSPPNSARGRAEAPAQTPTRQSSGFDDFEDSIPF